MFRRKPKPESRIVTAHLNDSEFEALKAESIARHNEIGGSLSSLKSELRALELAREEQSAQREPS